MLPMGGSAYPPYPPQGLGQQPHHQGINPAMLASYHQPQPPQSPYAGVSPAQLLNGTNPPNHMHQHQQPNQQQHMMMMNGAGLNPSALSAPNPGMASGVGGGGGMNGFMNSPGSNMPPQMNPQMQQLPQMTPQMLQILASAGVTREQFVGMNPAERQVAVRDAMMAVRQRHQQAQQQHFPPDRGPFDRPGSAMGMGMGSGGPPPGMGSSEYQQRPSTPQHGGPQQSSFQPKFAPPHFGPGPPSIGTPPPGMPPQQQPAHNSFGTPASPFNRSAQSLPPSDPQQQMQRSNSIGPTQMLRSSSGPQSNGYPQSNGGTPQPPHRPPQFGPQALTPQRQSTPSQSPVKRAPSPPGRTESRALIPGDAPPSALPDSTAFGNTSAASLPPLPASVQLNPAVTSVTVVPLATSLTAIPPIDADELKNIKDWMEVDRKYDGVHREMKHRMKAELQEALGPRHVPWWEKGTLDTNASRFLHGREQFDVKYPYRKQDRESTRKPPKREGMRLPRQPDPEDANRPEELVPIRLEFDVDHHKVRDTFVWNMNAPFITAEHFAQTVVEDYKLASSYHAVIVKAIHDQLTDYRAHSPNYDGDSWKVVRTNETLRSGTLEGESAEFWHNWRKRLRTEYGFVRAERNKRRKLRKVSQDEEENERPMSVEDFTINGKTLHEDLRILIRLDIIVGSVKLDDQFEWDLTNEDASPEEFAENYAQELGLNGEFKTAIVHSIREQVHAYRKCLYLVGHTMDGTPVEDDDLRNSFLPSLATGARAMEQVQAYTPLLNYLSDGELERHEKERDKETNKRRKKGRGGRRGIALPEREPIKTCRTPAIGFPEPDPATLAAAAAVNQPVSRRAAAAAASLTIANLVASENAPEHGDSPPQPMFRTSSLPAALPLPPPPVFKPKNTQGFFKPPLYDTSVLRPRAKVPAPTPSTAADISTLPAPLEDDPPPPPSVAAVVPDTRTPRIVTGKRAKELERSAKEREFAEGQQQNMINGVWHCSNCGCPESLAIGRRKGPLGDKSQCGTCGKYWHRYRKPRPVEYNSDYDFHANGAKKDAEAGKKRKGRPPGSTNAARTPADTSEPQTPRENGEAAPVREVSPASSASTASEMPLAQRVKINHTSSTPSLPPRRVSTPGIDAVDSNSVPPALSDPSTPAPVVSTPSASSAPPPPLTPAVPLPPRPTEPPEWLVDAVKALQARYVDDKFEVIPKATAVEWEWRLKCLDCPGKLYMPGEGRTLDNYELHLKNRLHRRRVSDRMRNSTAP
ncbi:hypothetical protein R3P38DRAFT_2841689 [Favolaschia claudopus]|uniref:SNF5-domain-containing protein n=1 Tax=Favolaschia claudopus TaxID=2862362 RepID=A0AAW0E009_9AGAR